MKTTKIFITTVCALAFVLISNSRVEAQSFQDESIRWGLFDKNGQLMPEKLTKEEQTLREIMKAPESEWPLELRCNELKLRIEQTNSFYFDEQGYLRTKLTRENFKKLGMPEYYYDDLVRLLGAENDMIHNNPRSTEEQKIYNIDFWIKSREKEFKEFKEVYEPKYLAEIAELEKQIEAEKKAGK